MENIVKKYKTSVHKTVKKWVPRLETLLDESESSQLWEPLLYGIYSPGNTILTVDQICP